MDEIIYNAYDVMFLSGIIIVLLAALITLWVMPKK